MRFLSLFSGIGGLDLGLERAGMTCVGQVEIDPYCRAVLAKHWPKVPQHDDVRTWTYDGTEIDLVCGGVPCQPASCAGKRKGAADERWLWGEFLRVVSAVRPAWVLAENVRGFLSLADSARVFDGLEAMHYEIGTLVLGAHHVGAPHKRDRVWIVAHAGHRGEPDGSRAPGRTIGERQSEWREPGRRGPRQLGQPVGTGLEGLGHVGATAHATRCPSRPGEPQHEWEAPRLVNTRVVLVAGGTPEQGRRPSTRVAAVGASVGSIDGEHARIGLIEPRVGLSTHGLPRRLAGLARRNALKALGNGCVPQVVEVIGRAIIEAHQQSA